MTETSLPITTRAVAVGLVAGAILLALPVVPAWETLTSERWLPWFSIGATLALQFLMGGVVLVLLVARGGSLGRLFGPLGLRDVVAPAVRLGGLQFLTAAGLVFLSFGLVALLLPGALETLAERGREVLPHDAGGARPALLALTLFSVAVAAPVSEEILFRGFLLQRWAGKWGVRAGLVGSAALFGILHFDLFPPAAFLAGLVSGVLYLRTRSLFAAMIAHLVNNGVIALLALANEVGGGRQAAELTPGDTRWLLAAGAALLLVGGPLLYRQLVRLWPGPDDPLPYAANASPPPPDGRPPGAGPHRA